MYNYRTDCLHSTRPRPELMGRRTDKRVRRLHRVVAQVGSLRNPQRRRGIRHKTRGLVADLSVTIAIAIVIVLLLLLLYCIII